MSAKRRYSFWIDDSHLEGLRALVARLGMSESEQIRRALDEWLTTHRGERRLLMDHTGAVQEIREGQAVTVTCPDCGGALSADKRFVSGHRHLNKPETRQPFWSTTCAACGHRFNYFPEDGTIRRFKP